MTMGIWVAMGSQLQLWKVMFPESSSYVYKTKNQVVEDYDLSNAVSSSEDLA